MCPGKKDTYRPGMAGFGIPEHDGFFYFGTGMQLRLSLLIREMEGKRAAAGGNISPYETIRLVG